MTWLAVVLGLAALALVASHLVETRRTWPSAPAALAWAPNADYGFRDVAGMRLRYLKTGAGRPVVLVHTLRTQLDLFRDVIPKLDGAAEVHAFDLPGHGYSEIVPGPYDPALFARAVRGYLDSFDLSNVVIVGESIGGALGLKLAAEHNPRIARVVAVNSYDYDRGRGILRGSPISAMLFGLTGVPLMGGMVWRLRWPGAFAMVIKASVNRPRQLPQDLVNEMHRVGNRPGHYRAFMSLIAHFADWEALRAAYPAIRVPVSLVYGEHDWSFPSEREAGRALIPDAALTVVPGAGHLMSFDAPEAVVAHALDAVKA